MADFGRTVNMRKTVLLLLLLPVLLAARAPWPPLERNHKPWTRWWWHGSAVDRENLTAELERLAAAGFGGVEITTIYGVKGAEARVLPYLSPAWTEMFRFAAEEAVRLGLGVDMPPGSGWRTGGPWVRKEHANTSVKISRFEAAPDKPLTVDATKRLIDAVIAYPERGEPLDLTRRLADGKLRWAAPARQWTVYVVERVPSGDSVKRPAPGGEGDAIDVYSPAAFAAFFEAFEQRLAPAERRKVRSWFHDSFEYRGDWSHVFLDEFQKRRGYDLKREIRALVGDESPERSARVLSDYRETISDLLHDNFVERLTAWAHAQGGLNRNQAHGSPGNLLDLYAACDIPETEIFGRLGGPDSNPLINKFASSAAHVTGKRLISSESYTWLNEHFQTTLAELKAATDQLFLTGVNHIFFHGTAYSPTDAPWPGWVFYASVQANPRNPLWKDIPALTAYIARCQSVLQSGRAGNDLLLYWPYYDVIDNPGPMFQQLSVHSPSWFYQEAIGGIAAELWRNGFGFDYISDGQLDRLGVRAPYKAVIVPACRRMPAATFRTLLEAARTGAAVIFQNQLPDDVPGLARLPERRAEIEKLKASLRFHLNPTGQMEAAAGKGKILIAANILRALDAVRIPREPFSEHQIQFIRRSQKTGYSYFLRNGGDTPFDGWISPAVKMESAVLMDPMSGASGTVEQRANRQGAAEVHLQLDPGETIILRTYDTGTAPGGPWHYREPAGSAITLAGEWRVRFVEGGPRLPAGYNTRRLESWTARGGDAEAFAGTARYSLRFENSSTAGSWLLDLGEVRDSARVRLNGKDVETLITPPYRIQTGPLKPAGNLLEVDVTSVGANRIRDMDLRKIPWRVFYDINVVNTKYQPFDASVWPIRPAGLLGPVRLIPLKVGQ